MPSASKRLAARGAHRPEVAQRDLRAPAQLDREHGIGRPRVQRPCATLRRPARAQHQVGSSRRRPDRATSGRSRGSKEASQSMKHTTSELRRAEPGEARRAEPRRALDHHPRAQLRRQRTRAVGRAVVDHERRVAVRHPLEHPRQRLTLVQDRQDHVGHERGRYSLAASMPGADPRHRRRRLHRLPRRRRPARARPRGPRSWTRCSTPRTANARPTSTSARTSSRPTCAIRTRSPRRWTA